MYGLEQEDIQKINSVFKNHTAIEKAILYGSRAKGNYKPYSDIDLTLVGKSLTLSEQFSIETELDDLLLPYKIDLSIYHKIENQDLTDHIDRVGIVFYKYDELLGWKDQRLDEFANINPRESLTKGTIAKKVPMEAVQTFVKKIPEYVLEEYKGGVKFRNGDTLMARITPSLENGKTSFVDFLEEDEIGFGSTEFIVLRAKEGISDSNYLYYLSISPDLREIAIQSMTGSSGRQRVQTDVVKEYEFLFPPLNEQQAIAEVLSSLDAKIDLLHRQNKTLEALAETLFRQWFDDKEFDSTVKDLVNVQNGYAFKSKDFKDFGVNKVIKIKNISGNKVDISAADFISEEVASKTNEKFKISTGDILFAMTGAEIGKMGIVETNTQNLWLNQRVGLLNEKYKGAKYLAYLCLQSDFGQDYIEHAATGSAQPNISSTGIEACPFPKLTKNQIIEYSNTISPFYDKVIFNLGEIKTLEKTRDTLLPKLMSGEVRVKIN